VKKFLRKLPWIAIPVVVVSLLVFAFMPAPAEADVVKVTRGPLEVTVSEDGRTRIKERYIVSSPLTGRMVRIPLKAGDPVTENITVISSLEPTDPALLDPRALSEAEARVKASHSEVEKATSQRNRTKIASEHAQREYRRVKDLHDKGAAPDQELADMTTRDVLAQEDYRMARAAVTKAEFELQLAQAGLIRTRPTSPGDNGNTRFEIRSPITGKVLKVHQESTSVVTPGQKLVEVGDPQDLEVEVDVLSSDAVKIPDNARVRLEHWGGEYPLKAEVRLVEPSGFMKQSALGVEEQRVWVIIRLLEPYERRKTLGDGFRVVAKIVTWESPSVLKVPTGCLHRFQGKQAVWIVQDDRAQRRVVTVGHNNGIEAEILDGLQEGDEVILHPSDKVQEGKAIERRSP